MGGRFLASYSAPHRPTIRKAALMRITTLYLEDSAATVSRMSAPVPDAEAPAYPTTLSASTEDSSEAAWDAFERATFPDLT